VVEVLTFGSAGGDGKDHEQEGAENGSKQARVADEQTVNFVKVSEAKARRRER
jgi:hypothetical protein